MGIFLRGNIWFCDFTDHSGKRIRKSLHTESKIEAQELFDRLKSDSWRVRHLKEKEKHTFEDACERWIKEKKTKRTIKGDISKLKRLAIKFGKRLLADIEAGELTAFVYSQSNEKHRQNWEAKKQSNEDNNLPIGKYRPKPVKIATSISYIRLLKALFRAAAFEWGWLENPLYFKVPQPDSSRTRWLRKNEVQRLLSELPEYFKDVVRFALATGLRRSNIINLKWTQVDIERGVAWIDADEMKGKKPIGVVFNRTAASIVSKQIGNHQVWVFTREQQYKNTKGDKFIARVKLKVDSNRAWRTALKKAGITDFRFHDLRHTWASWLVQSGVTLAILQEMGGWESISMVQRYAHLAPEHLREHANKLDDMIPD
ncbi:tyrosine-type recombinase/integrase [Providencia stuartii]|uniref:tyrosine-type recombinase/integrase n=1 Tax=Providencia stuartii TaxID=588 RepID=UPI003D7F566F